MTITRDDIVEAARGWIGTPFAHQGRLKGRAVDCIGLVLGVARELNITNYSPPAYSSDPDAGMMYGELLRNLRPIPTRLAQRGDIFYMRFTREPQHLAIWTGKDRTIIHAYQQAGKCVEHEYTDKWRARSVRAFSFVGAPCLLQPVA